MKVTIIGTGSWGTALAQVLIDNQVDVTLYGRNQEEVDEINNFHTNKRYFDAILPLNLLATSCIECVEDSDIVLFAVPSIAIEEVCKNINPYLHKKTIFINTAKGFHPQTHQRLSEVIVQNIDEEKCASVTCLIGPSHAEEVIERKITAINIVGENETILEEIQNLFSNQYFRVYRNTDLIGAEIGVALKNIMAIASGLLAGQNEGDNARAALVTRGLAEISRYGIYHGGKKETYLGLCGVGDLVVTCTSVHSRNFMAGYQIGQSQDVKQFLKSNTKTVEGIIATKIVYEESQKLGISMPITTAMYELLYEYKKPKDIIFELMSRDLKHED